VLHLLALLKASIGVVKCIQTAQQFLIKNQIPSLHSDRILQILLLAAVFQKLQLGSVVIILYPQMKVIGM
jgi:hypothetical protein